MFAAINHRLRLSCAVTAALVRFPSQILRNLSFPITTTCSPANTIMAHMLASLLARRCMAKRPIKTFASDQVRPINRQRSAVVVVKSVIYSTYSA